MKAFLVKTNKYSGTDFREVHKKAFHLYTSIKSKSKRRPYIRSTYFRSDKIFLDLFWKRLFDNPNWRDRTRRLKYYPCAIELARKTTYEPSSKENPNKKREILHRFAGITKGKDIFYIQIREDKRTDQKWLMSVFPPDTK